MRKVLAATVMTVGLAAAPTMDVVHAQGAEAAEDDDDDSDMGWIGLGGLLGLLGLLGLKRPARDDVRLRSQYDVGR